MVFRHAPIPRKGSGNQQQQQHGEEVRASASKSVDLEFIPQVESHQKTLKNGIHSFPAWCSANSDSVENNLANLLVFPWAGHLTGCLHLHVADTWRGQAVYPSWWPSLTKDMQTEHELVRINREATYIILLSEQLFQVHKAFNI